jgi:hypothetical protein
MGVGGSAGQAAGPDRAEQGRAEQGEEADRATWRIRKASGREARWQLGEEEKSGYEQDGVSSSFVSTKESEGQSTDLDRTREMTMDDAIYSTAQHSTLQWRWLLLAGIRTLYFRTLPYST